ncbi:hypothetical protein 3 [Changjiang tombus-like virus 18]|uniref:hypothetical protein 3 n=1 Tax=Changjiang tombus-like virus 18 TaxID=1922811 RepID=UPI000909FF37|nr:hypothetical protein 3 [Changjiang tombus-like virus 18]APG76223.1 hypothetical protein 3 [Changjiang tombus-like virus 18]
MFKTLNQKQLALARTRSKKILANRYLNCRYNPFESRGGAMIPDGIGKHLESRDFRSIYHLKVTGQAEVLILPAIPMVAAVISPEGNTLEVNGMSIINGSYVGLCGSNLLKYNTPLGGTVVQGDDVTSARIVTVGYRLTYEGKATEANGQLVANSLPLMLDGSPMLNSGSYVFSGGNPVTKVAGSMTAINIDMETNAHVTTRDTKIFRPEEGVAGVLKRQVTVANHAFKPFWETGVYPNNLNGLDNVSKAAWLQNPPAGLVDNNSISYPTVAVLDHALGVESIVINNDNTTPLLYRLEIIHCVQFQHSPNWGLADLTVDAPAVDKQALEADDRLNSTVTHAVDATSSTIPTRYSSTVGPATSSIFSDVTMDMSTTKTTTRSPYARTTTVLQQPKRKATTKATPSPAKKAGKK